jgi:dephospho-CoA kinase
MLIGVVGSIASGKDTLADYLQDKGFMAESLSAILREVMTAEGESIDVVNMTHYGNRLRETKGPGYLAIEAAKRIGDNDGVITSIRQVGEIESLKSTRQDFILLKTDAPIEMRYERLRKRNRAGDIQSLDDLKEIEDAQATGDGGSMNMNACYELADEEIINDGTIEEFYRKIDAFIERHKK